MLEEVVVAVAGEEMGQARKCFVLADSFIYLLLLSRSVTH